MEDKNTNCDNDFLGFLGDKDIKKIIMEETILLTDKIEKINNMGLKQKRNIMITNVALYNFEKKSLKRRFDLNYLKGISIAKDPKNEELVIHGNEAEYDYYYLYPKKTRIVEIIGKAFLQLLKKDIKICYIDLKSLKNIVTSQKEKKKDTSFSKMPNSNIISFSEYINNNQNIIRKEESRDSITLYSQNKDIKEVKLEDFEIIKVIGRGTFGKVYLVEFKKTKEPYAMKALKKNELINQDQIESTLLEKQILMDFQHPFLCSLNFCFQTFERVYFVMPFFRGGELFQQLKISRIFNEEKVRFYSSQLAIGLQHLHSSGIIYRDLKPENILISEDGYLKLADFGMAKALKENERAQSFCGTAEYLCPEILTGIGYNKSADWWSFGILMYEMLCGIPPFYDQNEDRMFDKIQNSEIRFPTKIKISLDAQDIISKLLIKNPSERLGAINGINDIKSHPFFLNIDFDLVLRKKITPPFIPEISGNLDVKNFDVTFTDEPIQNSVIDIQNLALISKYKEKFDKFS